MPLEPRKEFPVGTLEEYSGLTIEEAFDKLLTLPYFENIVALAEVDLIRAKLNTFTTRTNKAIDIDDELEWADLTREPAKELHLPMSLSISCEKSDTSRREKRQREIKIAILYNCVYVLSLWLNPQVHNVYASHILSLSQLQEKLMPEIQEIISKYKANRGKTKSKDIFQTDNANKNKARSNNTPKSNDTWVKLERFRNVAVLAGIVLRDTNTQGVLLAVSGLLAEQTICTTGGGEKQEATWRKAIINQIQEVFGSKIESLKSKKLLKRQLDKGKNYYQNLYLDPDHPHAIVRLPSTSKRLKLTLEEACTTNETASSNTNSSYFSDANRVASEKITAAERNEQHMLSEIGSIDIDTEVTLDTIEKILTTNSFTLFNSPNNLTSSTDEDEFAQTLRKELFPE